MFYHVEINNHDDGIPSPAKMDRYNTPFDVGHEWHFEDRHHCYYLPVREIPYTLHGDYVGSLVERSNYEVILETLKDDDEDGPGGRSRIVELYGGYGARLLAWPAWCPITPDLAEILEGLESYPLVDDEHESALEWDESLKAWDDYAWGDVKRYLLKWAEDLSESLCEILDDMNADEGAEWAHAAEDGGNSLWEMEGNGVVWQTAEVAKRIQGLIEGTRTLRYTDPPTNMAQLQAVFRDAAGNDE